MKLFLKRLSRLQYLGLLGFLHIFFKHSFWRYLWLFFLFGFIDIFLQPYAFIQSMAQVIGMVIAPIKHGFNPPSPNNYTHTVNYRLPFNGTYTVVNGGINRKSSHSWSIQTQRYAYDFIMLDQEGHSHKNDGTSVSDYYCYGQPILAPADGRVIEVENHYKDSRVFGNGQVDCTAKDIRGNYILIQHAKKEYSLLAHLKSKSINVTVGETVSAGQVIALCGNSGNTSEPHLHFHLQDTPDFYSSSGLPIYFYGIKISPAPHYKNYDSRPIPSFNPIENPHYISRGYEVSPSDV